MRPSCIVCAKQMHLAQVLVCHTHAWHSLKSALACSETQTPFSPKRYIIADASAFCFFPVLDEPGWFSSEGNEANDNLRGRAFTQEQR